MLYAWRQATASARFTIARLLLTQEDCATGIARKSDGNERPKNREREREKGKTEEVGTAAYIPYSQLDPLVQNKL